MRQIRAAATLVKAAGASSIISSMICSTGLTSVANAAEFVELTWLPIEEAQNLDLPLITVMCESVEVVHFTGIVSARLTYSDVRIVLCFLQICRRR